MQVPDQVIPAILEAWPELKEKVKPTNEKLFRKALTVGLLAGVNEALKLEKNGVR